MAVASASAGVGSLRPRRGLPRLLRLRQVAEVLGVSEQWVYRVIKDPEQRATDGSVRCAGLAKLPSFPHPAGGRAVREDVLISWMREELPPGALPPELQAS